MQSNITSHLIDGTAQFQFINPLFLQSSIEKCAVLIVQPFILLYILNPINVFPRE